MTVLLVINDAPYGTEKAYNALRLAITMQKEQPDAGVHVFLMADAVGCAIPGQATPQGYYNVERMLKAVVSRGGRVKACGSCLDARGLHAAPLVDGVEASTMSELAAWVAGADKVLTF
jgi:uncharacterized protein involved in oxidation of intracellular sulfur